MPESIGRIQEFFQGKNPAAVVLIQDAHAIPDAQKNIQKVIGWFQTEYGVERTALEGASERLDAQIFRSFPDKKNLESALRSYMDRGELSGGAAAAIINEFPGIYQGVEDWALYQDGLRLYREAAENEKRLRPRLAGLRRKLEADKKAVYSSELLELDRTLSDFDSDQTRFADVLVQLSHFRAPAHGSSLALLLEEIKREELNMDWAGKEAAEAAKKIMRAGRFDSAEIKADFQEKFQAFQTSRIPAVEFAAYLSRFSPSFSKNLSQLVQNHRRISGIEGASLFKEFENYALSIKEGLLKTRKEKNLDVKSRRVRLLEKLSKLELSHEEWREIENASWMARAAAPMKMHFDFYRNAGKRDKAFYENLKGLTGGKTPAMMVAGGFHTQGLTRQLKAEGISYLIVTPEVADLSGRHFYQEQMAGKVSWAKYFKPENGRVNLYQAFVRAVRDSLLVKADLKQWRDQIIRDLAGRNNAASARQYTSFLDEVMSPQEKNAARYPWQKKMNEFIGGLRELQAAGRLNEKNITSLLRPSNIVTQTGGPAVLQRGAWMPQPLQRSELRMPQMQMDLKFPLYFEPEVLEALEKIDPENLVLTPLTSTKFSDLFEFWLQVGSKKVHLLLKRPHVLESSADQLALDRLNQNEVDIMKDILGHPRYPKNGERIMIGRHWLQHPKVRLGTWNEKLKGLVFPFLELHQDSADAQQAFIESSTPLPGPHYMSLALQMTGSVGFLHHLGIVHRDIKPANFFIFKNGVILTDFNLAYNMTAGRPSLMGGTPLYAPREQWEGETPAPKDDVYALGMTLLRIWLATHRTAPPSTHVGYTSLTGAPIREDVDYRDCPLQEVIQKAMGPIEERYANAVEMEIAIRAVQAQLKKAEAKVEPEKEADEEKPQRAGPVQEAETQLAEDTQQEEDRVPVISPGRRLRPETTGIVNSIGETGENEAPVFPIIRDWDDRQQAIEMIRAIDPELELKNIESRGPSGLLYLVLDKRRERQIKEQIETITEQNLQAGPENQQPLPSLDAANVFLKIPISERYWSDRASVNSDAKRSILNHGAHSIFSTDITLGFQAQTTGFVSAPIGFYHIKIRDADGIDFTTYALKIEYDMGQEIHEYIGNDPERTRQFARQFSLLVLRLKAIGMTLKGLGKGDEEVLEARNFRMAFGLPEDQALRMPSLWKLRTAGKNSELIPSEAEALTRLLVDGMKKVFSTIQSEQPVSLIDEELEAGVKEALAEFHGGNTMNAAPAGARSELREASANAKKWIGVFEKEISGSAGMAEAWLKIQNDIAYLLWKSFGRPPRSDSLPPSLLLLDEDLIEIGKAMTRAWQKKGWNTGELHYLIAYGKQDDGLLTSYVEGEKRRLLLEQGSVEDELTAGWIHGMGHAIHLRYFGLHGEGNADRPPDNELHAFFTKIFMEKLLLWDKASGKDTEKTQFRDVMLWGLTVMLDPVLHDFEVGNLASTDLELRHVWKNGRESVLEYILKIFEGMPPADREKTEDLLAEVLSRSEKTWRDLGFRSPWKFSMTSLRNFNDFIPSQKPADAFQPWVLNFALASSSIFDAAANISKTRLSNESVEIQFKTLYYDREQAQKYVFLNWPELAGIFPGLRGKVEIRTPLKQRTLLRNYSERKNLMRLRLLLERNRWQEMPDPDVIFKSTNTEFSSLKKAAGKAMADQIGLGKLEKLRNDHPEDEKEMFELAARLGISESAARSEARTLPPIESLGWQDPETLTHFRALLAHYHYPLPRTFIKNGEPRTGGRSEKNPKPFTLENLKDFAKGQSPAAFYKQLAGDLYASVVIGMELANQSRPFYEHFGIWPGAVSWFGDTDRFSETSLIHKWVRETAAKGKSHFKVLVQAAWNGEEAYEMALTLKHFFPALTFEIIGKDIVPPDPEELSWLPEEDIPGFLKGETEKYFEYKKNEQKKDGIKVLSLKKEHLPLVKLTQGDVLDPASNEKDMDIVYAARLVMVYLTDENEAVKAVENMRDSLVNYGILVLPTAPYYRKKLEDFMHAHFVDTGKFRRVGEGIYKKLPRSEMRQGKSDVSFRWFSELTPEQTAGPVENLVQRVWAPVYYHDWDGQKNDALVLYRGNSPAAVYGYKTDPNEPGRAQGTGIYVSGPEAGEDLRGQNYGSMLRDELFGRLKEKFQFFLIGTEKNGGISAGEKAQRFHRRLLDENPQAITRIEFYPDWLKKSVIYSVSSVEQLGELLAANSGRPVKLTEIDLQKYKPRSEVRAEEKDVVSKPEADKEIRMVSLKEARAVLGMNKLVKAHERLYRDTFKEPELFKVAVDMAFNDILLSSSKGLGYVLLNSRDEIVGTILTYYDPPYDPQDALISRIAIRSDYQGRGYSRMLLHASALKILEGGIKKIKLQVKDGNPAREIYIQYGFKETGSETSELGLWWSYEIATDDLIKNTAPKMDASAADPDSSRSEVRSQEEADLRKFLEAMAPLKYELYTALEAYKKNYEPDSSGQRKWKETFKKVEEAFSVFKGAPVQTKDLKSPVNDVLGNWLSSINTYSALVDLSGWQYLSQLETSVNFFFEEIEKLRLILEKGKFQDIHSFHRGSEHFDIVPLIRAPLIAAFKKQIIDYFNALAPGLKQELQKELEKIFLVGGEEDAKGTAKMMSNEVVRFVQTYVSLHRQFREFYQKQGVSEPELTKVSQIFTMAVVVVYSKLGEIADDIKKDENDKEKFAAFLNMFNTGGVQFQILMKMNWQKSSGLTDAQREIFKRAVEMVLEAVEKPVAEVLRQTEAYTAQADIPGVESVEERMRVVGKIFLEAYQAFLKPKLLIAQAMKTMDDGIGRGAEKQIFYEALTSLTARSETRSEKFDVQKTQSGWLRDKLNLKSDEVMKMVEDKEVGWSMIKLAEKLRIQYSGQVPYYRQMGGSVGMAVAMGIEAAFKERIEKFFRESDADFEVTAVAAGLDVVSLRAAYPKLALYVDKKETALSSIIPPPGLLLPRIISVLPVHKASRKKINGRPHLLAYLQEKTGKGDTEPEQIKKYILEWLAWQDEKKASWPLVLLKNQLSELLPEVGFTGLSYARMLWGLDIYAEYQAEFNSRFESFAGSLTSAGKTFGFSDKAAGTNIRKLNDGLREFLPKKTDAAPAETGKKVGQIADISSLRLLEALSKETGNSVSPADIVKELDSPGVDWDFTVFFSRHPSIQWIQSRGYEVFIKAAGIEEQTRAKLRERFESYHGVMTLIAPAFGVHDAAVRSLYKSSGLNTESMAIPQEGLLKFFGVKKIDLLSQMADSEWENLAGLRTELFKALNKKRTEQLKEKVFTIADIIWGAGLADAFEEELRKRQADEAAYHGSLMLIGQSFGFQANGRRDLVKISESLKDFHKRERRSGRREDFAGMQRAIQDLINDPDKEFNHIRVMRTAKAYWSPLPLTALAVDRRELIDSIQKDIASNLKGPYAWRVQDGTLFFYTEGNPAFRSEVRANLSVDEAVTLLKAAGVPDDLDAHDFEIELIHSQRLAEEILKHPIEKIMIVGDALGSLGLLLMLTGKDVTFADRLSRVINLLKKRHETLQAMGADLPELKALQITFGAEHFTRADLEWGSFDLVTMIDLVGPDPIDYDGWFPQAKKLLKPQGGFLVVDEYFDFYSLSEKEKKSIRESFDIHFPVKKLVTPDSFTGMYNLNDDLGFPAVDGRNYFYQVGARSEVRKPWEATGGLLSFEQLKEELQAEFSWKLSNWRIEKSIGAISDTEWKELKELLISRNYFGDYLDRLRREGRYLEYSPVMELEDLLNAEQRAMPYFSESDTMTKQSWTDEERHPENFKLWKDMLRVSQQHHVLAHGTWGNYKGTMGYGGHYMRPFQLEWALLGIMFDGIIKYGDAAHLYMDARNPASNAANYGPYYVILPPGYRGMKDRNSYRGFSSAVNGAPSERGDQRVYLVPAEESRRFFEAGLDLSVKFGFIDRAASESEKNKILTYAEWIQLEAQIPEILKGEKSPRSFLGARSEVRMDDAEKEQHLAAIGKVEEIINDSSLGSQQKRAVMELLREARESVAADKPVEMASLIYEAYSAYPESSLKSISAGKEALEALNASVKHYIPAKKTGPKPRKKPRSEIRTETRIKQDAEEGPYGIDPARLIIGNVSSGLYSEDDDEIGFDGAIVKSIRNAQKRASLAGRRARVLVVGVGIGVIIDDLRKDFPDVELEFINKKEIKLHPDINRAAEILSKYTQTDRAAKKQLSPLSAPEALEALEFTLKNARLHDVNEGLPYEDGVFDTVLVPRSVLGYIEKKDLLLKEVKRVLVKDGEGFVQDFSGFEMSGVDLEAFFQSVPGQEYEYQVKAAPKNPDWTYPLLRIINKKPGVFLPELKLLSSRPNYFFPNDPIYLNVYQLTEKVESRSEMRSAVMALAAKAGVQYFKTERWQNGWNMRRFIKFAAMDEFIPAAEAAVEEAVLEEDAALAAAGKKYADAVRAIARPVYVEYRISDRGLSKMAGGAEKVIQNLLQAAHDAVAINENIVVRVTVPKRVRHQLKVRDHNGRENFKVRAMGNTISFFHARSESLLEKTPELIISDMPGTGNVLLSDRYEEGELDYKGADGQGLAARILTAGFVSLSKKSFDLLVKADGREDRKRVRNAIGLRQMAAAIQEISAYRLGALRLQASA